MPNFIEIGGGSRKFSKKLVDLTRNDPNGKSNSNISEIAEEFNNFFKNIGEQTAKNLPQPTNSFSDYLNGNYAANLFMFPTCEIEILHTTTNLKASTSEGYDNVSTKLLKQTVKEVATPLAHIINLSLSHGIFPNDMKLAKIVPIFKMETPNYSIITDQ